MKHTSDKNHVFLIIWPFGKPQWILVEGYQLGKVGFLLVLFFRKEKIKCKWVVWVVGGSE